MLQHFLLFVVAVSAQTVPKVTTYKGYEFSFYTNEASGKLTYDDAKQVCVDAGARLAEIKSAAVQDFITTQLTDLGLVESWSSWAQGYWIGGVCGGGIDGRNNWKWEDGTSIGGSNYKNLFAGGGCPFYEPNSNYASSRSYIYSFKEGYYCSLTCTGSLGAWGDDDKSTMKNWICMKDLCNPSPCENGGTCVPETGDYSCNCLNGFEGKNCSIDICDPNPCGNGGTCNHAPGGYQCNCADGFVGDYCQTDLCDPNPCENGGTCNHASGGYQCNCANGFIGDYCQTDLCASKSCQNNGTCVPQAGSYSCLCADGIVGQNCEADLCDPSACENSGTCVRKVGGNFLCDCEPAYTGTLCENANYESSNNVDYLLHINYNSFSTFLRSSEDCRSNGQSDLVIIKNAQTQQSIENKAIELYGQGAKEFWIGAERKHAGWFWLDGSQLTFTNWGETGNDGAGNCLKMVSQSGRSQLQWISGQCEEQLGYICEKTANNTDPCMETECLNSGTCFSSGSHFNCQCVAGFKGINCEIKISDPTIAILASIIGVLALVIIILVLAYVYMRRKGISPKHVQSIKSKQTSGELRNPTEGDYLEINGTGQATSAQHNVMAQQSQYVNDGISGLENETCDTTKYPPTNATSTTDNHQYEEIAHKCR